MQTVATRARAGHPQPAPSDTFRRLISLADAVQKANAASDGAMAERCGLMRESYVRARRKGRTGKGDVETMTEQRIAAGLGLRVGLLSGAAAPLTAALADAVAALRRAEDAAELAVDRGALALIRPAIRDLERLLGAPTAPALRPEDGVTLLGLTLRAWGTINAAGITQIRDLTARTAGDLLMLRGFGPGCLREVEEALAAHGLRLAGGAS